MNIVKKGIAFKNNQGVIKYFKNTSWLLGEKVLRLTVGIFVGIWVARYLGPERFGLFSYAQSFVGLFSAIATLGLDGIVIRELVKDENQRDQLLGTAFILKLIGAVLVLFLLAISMLFQSNDIQTIVMIFLIASATVLQSFNVIDFYFQSKVLSKFVVYSNLFSILLSSVIKVVLISYEAPLIAFAYVVLFDSIILASGLVFFYFKSKFSISTWNFSLNLAKSLLKDSWPLILSGLVISIYMKIDQVMVKEMLGADAVGQYAAATRLSEAWYFIPMVISSSLFPAILNARKISKELYYSRFQKLYDLMAWIAIAIAIPMTFLSERLVLLLYGTQYNDAGGVLMLHIWSAVFVFLGVASSKWFVAENLQKYSLYRTFAGAIVNIILNYILIPQYGICGAAIATLAAQIIASYLYNITCKKLRVTFVLQSKALLLPFRKRGT